MGQGKENLGFSLHCMRPVCLESRLDKMLQGKEMLGRTHRRGKFPDYLNFYGDTMKQFSYKKI